MFDPESHGVWWVSLVVLGCFELDDEAVNIFLKLCENLNLKDHIPDLDAAKQKLQQMAEAYGSFYRRGEPVYPEIYKIIEDVQLFG